jgi:hypothetical protein
MKFKFTSDNFLGYFGIEASEKAADFANAALDKYRAEHGVVVWQPQTDPTKPGIHKLTSEWIEMDEYPGATHHALLIDIEPLEVKPCEHEPAINAAGNYEPTCYKCNIKLKFTWEPAE